MNNSQPVAYFCAEYGFDTSLPLYAGGLGVLAGDTVRAAADVDDPFVAVGLLYRGKAMVQRITEDGCQEEDDFMFDPVSHGLEHVYVDGQPLFIKVHMTTTDVWLRCWKKTFSNNVTLYLLDSDTDQNDPPQRQITHRLYHGTDESQLQQMFLLGVGGVKLLNALGIHPQLYHLNEGRPAFLVWQLIRQYMELHAIDYESARKLAIQKVVYTNHTLVAAGNKVFSMDTLKSYCQYYAEKMNITTDYLLSPGWSEDGSGFSVTRFALNNSSKANGVSKLHSQLSMEQWPEYHWCNITNGVHLPTWQDHDIASATDGSELWSRHVELKATLATYVHHTTGYQYDSKQLILGWARRLAGYKQLPILFSDMQRIKAILHNQDRPVYLLIAGKVHQGDEAGKQMLQTVIGYMQNELSGQVLFIPNYNLEIAQQLTRGVDVWLNTPQIGKEACGTSGMKALVNGGLPCAVADGWSAEILPTDAGGWTIDHTKTAESLYTLLEEEIVPLYYQRNYSNIPEDWVARMQAALKHTQAVSAKRMFSEYQTTLYGLE